MIKQTSTSINMLKIFGYKIIQVYFSTFKRFPNPFRQRESLCLEIWKKSLIIIFRSVIYDFDFPMVEWLSVDFC